MIFEQPNNKEIMNRALHGKKIAILVADDFEQSELKKSCAALEDAGAETHIVSPELGEVKGWFSGSFPVDVKLKRANAADYDALLLPGGVTNPDKLRALPEAVAFVRSFFDAGKPVAAICHGPQILIEADVLQGRRLTSYPSVKTDLINAGAVWVDEKVVTDQGLVTSRIPDDLPFFNAEMIEEFAVRFRTGLPRA